MSVKVEAAAQSMPKPLDSLESTPDVMQPLHRVWFDINNTSTWYDIINEARTLYGRNWRGQSHVKRRLDKMAWHGNQPAITVWFDVPDPTFATWICVKCSVIARQKSR